VAQQAPPTAAAQQTPAAATDQQSPLADVGYQLPDGKVLTSALTSDMMNVNHVQFRSRRV
jgi:hypothetical protein